MLIVFKVTDSPHTDPNMYVQRYQRGDVIQILPDKHVFSERELTNRAWRIVKIADLTRSEAEALTSPEPDEDELHVRNWRRIRRLNLDHAAIPVAIKAFIDDDSRTRAILTLDGGRALLNDIVEQKTAADLRR